MSEAAVPQIPRESDHDFVRRLRQVVEDYLRVIDEWQIVYRQFNRVTAAHQVSSDLQPIHDRLLESAKHVRECVPRARQLCLKHNLHNPWTSVLRVDLDVNPLQSGAATVLGRAERLALTECLLELGAATEPEPADAPTRELSTPPESGSRGLFQRVLGFFA